jgi:hypothetical protein
LGRLREILELGLAEVDVDAFAGQVERRLQQSRGEGFCAAG